MADSKAVYGLTAAAARLVKEMADKHRQQLPAAGYRTRRTGAGTPKR